MHVFLLTGLRLRTLLTTIMCFFVCVARQAHAGYAFTHSFLHTGSCWVYNHALLCLRSCDPFLPAGSYWVRTVTHSSFPAGSLLDVYVYALLSLCEGSCWVYDHALLCLRSCKPFLPTGSCWVYVHTLLSPRRFILGLCVHPPLSLRRLMLGLQSLTALSTIMHPFLPTDSCWAYVDVFLLPRRFILGLYVHALLSPRRFTWV